MAHEEEAAQPLFAVLRGVADVIARLLTGATTPLTNFAKGMGKFAWDSCKQVLKGIPQVAGKAIKAGQNRSIGHGDYGLIKAGKFDRHMANDKFDMVDIQLNKKLDNKQMHDLNKRLRKCGIRATLAGDHVLRCSEQHKSIVERYVKAIESPAAKKKVKQKGKGKGKEAVALKKKGKHRPPKHRRNFATCAAAGTALHAKPKTAAPKAKVKVKPPAAKLPLLKRQ